MSIWIRTARVPSLDRRQLSRREAKPLLEPNEQPELAIPQTILRQTESVDRPIVLGPYTTHWVPSNVSMVCDAYYGREVGERGRRRSANAAVLLGLRQ